MQQIIDKYLSDHSTVLLLALQAGILSTILAVVQVLFRPQSLDVLVALLGVFLAALVHVAGLHESSKRRKKYGYLITVTAGVTTMLGSACNGSLLATSIGIILLVPFVGFSAGGSPLAAGTVLFSVDMFIIGSGLPADWQQAAIYGLFFCVGGLLYDFVLLITGRFILHKPMDLAAHRSHKIHVKEIFDGRRSYYRFAFLLTVAVLLANAISLFYELPQGYWVPMTALLILKSDMAFSKKRISHRVGGTIIGCIFAAAILLYLHNLLILALLFLPFMTLTINAVARHYGSYAFFLTVMVSLLMNIAAHIGPQVAENRLTDTLIGIVLVIGVLTVINPFMNKFTELD